MPIYVKGLSPKFTEVYSNKTLARSSKFYSLNLLVLLYTLILF